MKPPSAPQNSAQNPDEIFDVVDGNDRVVGRATRAETHRKRLFHRAVHVLVFDARGNVLLQKRSAAKDTCPGLFSTSCAGHVDSGEDYAAAAERELREELGISVPEGFFGNESALLRHLPPCEATGFEHVNVYGLGNFTGTPAPNPAEIESVKWAAPEEVTRALAETPELFAESFRLVWRRLCAPEVLGETMRRIARAGVRS